MAVGLPGTVCAVEADAYCPHFASSLQASISRPGEPERSACIRVADNLWLATAESLSRGDHDAVASVWLRTRLSELRRNFDYTLIHAPAAFLPPTIVLGQLADGLILVLRAGSTRRAVAKATLATLKAAKVPVLGTVLIERTFPIPEKIYSRL